MDDSKVKVGHETGNSGSLKNKIVFHNKKILSHQLKQRYLEYVHEMQLNIKSHNDTFSAPSRQSSFNAEAHFPPC